jgi:hypothetical protein
MAGHAVPDPRRRDPRLVTIARGGTLSDTDHRLLAAWAADCAARVLHVFEEEHREDPRPARAIAAARSWSSGEIRAGEARSAAVDAHAAARAAHGPARDAARAAGHASAVAHMPDHELGAAYYALRATRAFGGDVDAERTWQVAALPAAIADLVREDMLRRVETFGGMLAPGG